MSQTKSRALRAIKEKRRYSRTENQHQRHISLIPNFSLVLLVSFVVLTSNNGTNRPSSICASTVTSTVDENPTKQPRLESAALIISSKMKSIKSAHDHYVLMCSSDPLLNG